MARAKKDESEFIVNAREPSFGVGIFVKTVGVPEQPSPDALVRNASQERPRYYGSTWE
jgi:hypothetical protein